MQLRPRLFLEGNLFVDLKPGSPDAPEAEDGYIVPINQTAVSVQLADVLGTLTSDVRRQPDPRRRAGRRARRSRRSRGAEHVLPLLSGCVPLHLAGQRGAARAPPRGPAGVIRNVDRVASALTRNEGQLEDLVTNLRVVTGSFASEDAALEQGIAELPRTLRAARPAFANLNAAFPSLRSFARGAARGRSLGPTVTAATPFARQLRPSRRGGSSAASRATFARPFPSSLPVALRRRLPRAGSRARELPRQRGHSVVQRRGRRRGRIPIRRSARSSRRPVTASWGSPGEPLGRRQRPDDPPRGRRERTSPAIRRASRIRSSGSRRCRCSVECPRSSRRRRRRSAPGSRARTRIRPTSRAVAAASRHRRATPPPPRSGRWSVSCGSCSGTRRTGPGTDDGPGVQGRFERAYAGFPSTSHATATGSGAGGGEDAARAQGAAQALA